MALIAIDAVIDISRNIWVMEIRRIVAPVASRALEDGIVVGVRVARRANTVGVAMGDRELRVLCVIEGGACPRGGVVAVLARSREELRLCGVTGIRRLIVVGLMASDAGGGQSRVVAVDVAVGAHPWRHGMRTGQREGRVVVIEGRVRPGRSVVTELTSCGESGRRVHGIVRVRVVLLVTRIAQATVQRIVAVDVAIGALTRRNCM